MLEIGLCTIREEALSMRLTVGLVLTSFSILAIPVGGSGSVLDFAYVAAFVIGAALIITSSRKKPANGRKG
jgi:Kef-type K+ transport system membrane component KefB